MTRTADGLAHLADEMFSESLARDRCFLRNCPPLVGQIWLRVREDAETSASPRRYNSAAGRCSLFRLDRWGRGARTRTLTLQNTCKCYLGCYLRGDDPNIHFVNSLILLAHRRGFEPLPPRFVDCRSADDFLNEAVVLTPHLWLLYASSLPRMSSIDQGRRGARRTVAAASAPQVPSAKAS